MVHDILSSHTKITIIANWPSEVDRLLNALEIQSLQTAQSRLGYTTQYLKKMAIDLDWTRIIGFLENCWLDIPPILKLRWANPECKICFIYPIEEQFERRQYKSAIWVQLETLTNIFAEFGENRLGIRQCHRLLEEVQDHTAGTKGCRLQIDKSVYELDKTLYSIRRKEKASVWCRRPQNFSVSLNTYSKKRRRTSALRSKTSMIFTKWFSKDPQRIPPRIMNYLDNVKLFLVFKPAHQAKLDQIRIESTLDTKEKVIQKTISLSFETTSTNCCQYGITPLEVNCPVPDIWVNGYGQVTGISSIVSSDATSTEIGNGTGRPETAEADEESIVEAEDENMAKEDEGSMIQKDETTADVDDKSTSDEDNESLSGLFPWYEYETFDCDQEFDGIFRHYTQLLWRAFSC
ncbi:hypothetical protein K469DRAFT_696452 [Zopfia rhizophila CBS 207.26]|uniref:Uncharacterized protein n=1 Tax=Zopfia rhizophila CBS 207.26 TaxID=1314779 RepID=A0A6A6DFA7_9PEZI|nr:hypothetical protein K469DRAFT_696452 [Zopfia rhizophila CBS 207.26]